MSKLSFLYLHHITINTMATTNTSIINIIVRQIILWPTNGTLAQKLYGTKQELTCTTDFIEASGLTI